MLGTLTKNEQTVTELYSVDETVSVSPYSPPSAAASTVKLSPAMLKALYVGCLCNNAFANEHGVNVGQATDVALLNVLEKFGVTDVREVRHCMLL